MDYCMCRICFTLGTINTPSVQHFEKHPIQETIKEHYKKCLLRKYDDL